MALRKMRQVLRVCGKKILVKKDNNLAWRVHPSYQTSTPSWYARRQIGLIHLVSADIRKIFLK